jgi:hypothetical protein
MMVMQELEQWVGVDGTVYAVQRDGLGCSQCEECENDNPVAGNLLIFPADQSGMREAGLCAEHLDNRRVTTTPERADG